MDSENMSNRHIKKTLLIILDGFGISQNTESNAIALAKTPNWDYYTSKYAFGTLDASGVAVGLPSGQFGNSEVGHLNIGAGRVVKQDITRISDSIADGEFYSNPILTEVINTTTSGTVHIIGLLSDGGVHAHIEHILALIKLYTKPYTTSHTGTPTTAHVTTNAPAPIKQIWLHLFLDGRDTPPQSALIFLEQLQTYLDTTDSFTSNDYEVKDRACAVKVATVSGRYYAMDRDRRYDRLQLAYNAIVGGFSKINDTKVPCANSALEVINNSYAENITDEFIKPHIINDYPGFKDGDSVIFANFRSDRAIQLTDAIIGEDFTHFTRFKVRLANFVTMTKYDARLPTKVAFAPIKINNTLGAYIASLGYTQLRIAETEKYPHVTYFFNGGEKTPYANEDRILVNSPRDVATYDQKPEMSLPEVTEKLVEAINRNQYELIVTNFANADMVGHSGNLMAATKAVEAIDYALGLVIKAMLNIGGEVLVIADHGNCEEMFDNKTHQLHTQHTTNLVPCLYVGRPGTIREHGTLQDVAPTLLAMAGLPKPSEMTGNSVIDFTICK